MYFPMTTEIKLPSGDVVKSITDCEDYGNGLRTMGQRRYYLNDEEVERWEYDEKLQVAKVYGMDGSCTVVGEAGKK